jgi:hypothetical protein
MAIFVQKFSNFLLVIVALFELFEVSSIVSAGGASVA